MTIENDQFFQYDKDSGEGSFEFVGEGGPAGFGGGDRLGDFIQTIEANRDPLGDFIQDRIDSQNQGIAAAGFTPVFSEDGEFSGFYKNQSGELVTKSEVESSLGITLIQDPKATTDSNWLSVPIGDNAGIGADAWNGVNGETVSQTVLQNVPGCSLTSAQGITQCATNIAQGLTDIAKSAISGIGNAISNSPSTSDALDRLRGTVSNWISNSDTQQSQISDNNNSLTSVWGPIKEFFSSIESKVTESFTKLGSTDITDATAKLVGDSRSLSSGDGSYLQCVITNTKETLGNNPVLIALPGGGIASTLLSAYDCLKNPVYTGPTNLAIASDPNFQLVGIISRSLSGTSQGVDAWDTSGIPFIDNIQPGSGTTYVLNFAENYDAVAAALDAFKPSDTVAKQIETQPTVTQVIRGYIDGVFPNLSSPEKTAVTQDILRTVVLTTENNTFVNPQTFVSEIAVSIAKSLDSTGEIHTKINANFATTVVAETTVKILPDEVKIELNNLLVQVQQSNTSSPSVYSTLNERFNTLRITKEDILYNFPSVTSQTIADFEKRGVTLYPSPTGTVSLGTPASSSNVTTSSSPINPNTGTVYIAATQLPQIAGTITNTIPNRGGYQGFRHLYDPNKNYSPKVALSVRELTMRIITGSPGGYGLRFYAENFPTGLYRVFLPPGTIQVKSIIQYGFNAEPPTGPGRYKPPAQKVSIRYKQAPETKDPNSFNTVSPFQSNLTGVLNKILSNEELKFYSQPGEGVLEVSKFSKISPTTTGNYCYFNFLEAPNKTIAAFEFIVEVDKESYEAWFTGAEWDLDGNPLASASHTANPYKDLTGFSSAQGQTVQERLFYYGESQTNGIKFSQETKKTMDAVPDLAPSWAYQDMAKAQVGGYLKNPTANVVSGLESIVTSLRDAANGSYGRTTIGEGDLGSFKNDGWESIVIESEITLNASTQFVAHTDRLVRPDSENVEPEKPTLNSAITVGKSLTYIVNQADSNRVEHAKTNIPATQKYQISGGSEQERIIELTDSGFSGTGVLRFLKNLYFLLVVLGPGRVLGPYSKLDPFDALNIPFDGTPFYSDKTQKRFQGFTIRSGKYQSGALKNVMKFDFTYNQNSIEFTPLIPAIEPVISSPDLFDVRETFVGEENDPRKWRSNDNAKDTRKGEFDVKKVFDYSNLPLPSQNDPQAHIKFYKAFLKYVKDAYPDEVTQAIDKSIISIDSIPYSKPNPLEPSRFIVTYSEDGNPQVASGGIDDSRIVTGAINSLFVEKTVKKFRDDLFPYVKIVTSSPEPTESKLKEIAALIKEAGDFLTNTRVNDEKYHENALKILNEFQYVKQIAKPGETEEYLYRNVIGTEKLLNRLDSNYDTVVPENTPVSKVPYLVDPNYTPPDDDGDFVIIDDNVIIIDGGGGGGGANTGGAGGFKPIDPNILVLKPYPNIENQSFRNSFIRLELLPSETETLAETPISVSDTDLDMDRPYNYGCCCFNIFKCLCEPPKRNKKKGFNLYTTEGVWAEKSFSLKNTGTMDFKFELSKCYFENNLTFAKLNSQLNGFNAYDYGSTETEIVGITTANTGIIEAGETATVTFKTKKTTGVYGELNTESWIDMDTNVPDVTPYDFRSGVNASTEKSKINLVIPFAYDPEVLVKVPFTVDLNYGSEGSLFGSPNANTPAYWTLSEYSTYPKLTATKLYPVNVPITIEGIVGVKHNNNLRPVGQQREKKLVTISNTDSPYKFKVAKSDVLKNGRTINVTSIQVVSNAPNNWNISLYTSSGSLVTTPFTIQPYEDVLLYAKVNTSISFVDSTKLFNPTKNTLLSPVVESGQVIESGATKEVVKYKITTATGQESYFGIYLSSDDIIGEFEEVITYNKNVTVNTNFTITISGGKPDTRFKFVTDTSSKNYKILANSNYILSNLQITSAGTYNYRFYFYGTDNERSIVITAS
jgi:hypothetical protein